AATRPGWLISSPCGASPSSPLASTVNVWPGHAIANMAFAALGTGGKVCFQSMTDVDLVVDVEGWFRAGASYHAFAPVRALDTREAGPAVAPGTVREGPLGGQVGGPAGAIAGHDNAHRRHRP